MTLTIFVSGLVPILCRASATALLCNAPAGYVLTAEGPEGTRIVEQSDGPAAKVLPPPRPGETYVVTPSTSR